MSTTPENPGVGPANQEASRQPWSNSVKPCNPQNPGAEEGQTYQEWVAAAAGERVSEFIDKYPYLARLPVTTRNGTTLRADVVEEIVEEQQYNPPEEWRDGFSIRHVDHHEVPTWAEAVYWFLTNRQAYDNGVYGHFEAVNGDNFHVQFNDAWTREYGEKQAAKNAGALRQLAGGEYPEEEESARSGESVEGEWGEVATIICALTASSTPTTFDDRQGKRPLHPDAAVGGRLPPVDHLNTTRDGWTEAAYDAVRNLLEYHYGLSSDEWGYIRGDEPHPGDGENACYAHTHPVVVFDVEAADVEADETVIQRDFHKQVIGAYLEENQYADSEAHDLESVTVKIGDVNKPAAYASKYLNLGDEKEMLEADIETVAWAAVTAISGRQRLARSQRLTEAAKADKCLQDPDTEHGEKVHRGGHGRIVCAECGSPVGVDAETLAEARIDAQPVATDGGEIQGRDLSPDDSSPARKIGVSAGVPPRHAKAWKQARRFVENDRRDADVLSAELVAVEIAMDDPPLEAVSAAVSGEELDGTPEPIYGEGKPPTPTADLLAVEKPSGLQEVSNGGGGGAPTVDVQLPVDRLWRNTRLRYWGSRGTPRIICEVDEERFATDNPRQAAGWLHNHGVEKPWHAEVCLSFRGVDWEPVAESPDGVPNVT